jgi:hypothetical protein
MGFEAGLSVVDLKLGGDWQSDAVERYLFVPSFRWWARRGLWRTLLQGRGYSMIVIVSGTS